MKHKHNLSHMCAHCASSIVFIHVQKQEKTKLSNTIPTYVIPALGKTIVSHVKFLHFHAIPCVLFAYYCHFIVRMPCMTTGADEHQLKKVVVRLLNLNHQLLFTIHTNGICHQEKRIFFSLRNFKHGS